MRIISRLFVLLIGGLLITLINPTVPHRSIARTTPQQAGCDPIAPQPPAQPDMDAARDYPWGDVPGERSLKSKDALFDEIVLNDGILGDFDYRVIVDQEGNKGNNIPPTMLRSVAGIESDWLQYELISGGSATLERHGDYGMMQINKGNPPENPSPLFARTRSLTENLNLCNDTMANIAAGATHLAQKWNDGYGNLPIVNDQNPNVIMNWYYALSAYNGAPSNRDSVPPVGRWMNNPNCDGIKLYCDNDPDDPDNFVYDYSSSRNPGAHWYILSPSTYPYQERVLYNTQFPRTPTETQWKGVDIGLLATRHSLRYTGIIPEESIFEYEEPDENGNPISRAPDLLLFRTKTGIVDGSTFPVTITIEYNLPVTAEVTIDLINEKNKKVDELIKGQRQPVPGDAMNVEHIPYTGSIPPGYGYRLHAQVSNTFEGKYIRQLRFVERDTFLPLVQR
jgi:hypothetical protein